MAATSGTSLVTDVLQKSGRLEKEDLQTRVGKLTQKALEVKAQVYESVYKQYTEFVHSYNLTMELNSKVKGLSSEMNYLNGKIKGDVETQLQKANSLYTNLSQQLNETNSIINVLQKLSEIHDSMSGLSVLNDCKEYYKASEVLNLVKSHLDDLPKSGDESKIFKALRAEYRLQYTELVYALESTWDKCISWKTLTTPSWDNIDGHFKTELKIYTSDTTNIDVALQTMESLKRLDKKLKDFGKRFLQFIIQPIVIFPRLKPVHNQNKENCSLSFTKDPSKTENIETTTVFDRMNKIFEALSSALMNKKVFKLGENGEKLETTLAFVLGELIWPTLSAIIIKDCLAKSVPKTSVQLEKYEGIIAATVKFEEKLVKTGYLKDGTNTLQTYSKDVTTHFSNKKCQDLLFTAREMLKSNVSFRNTVLVSIPEGHKGGPVSPLSDISNGNIDDKQKEKREEHSTRTADTATDNKLSDNMFHFPTCGVSECIPKFFDLVCKTLIEATETRTTGDVRLFFTVKNMFELYRVVVPTYYEEELRDLPQMSALHYNNCMYLSHHLLTLGHQFRPKLPPPLNSGTATFVDLVSPLRQLGEKCFEDQLRKQCRSLLDIIEGGGGFNDLNAMSMEKAFEQVCYQLLKLKKVWIDILPLNIYHSALGTLLNVALKKVVDEILKLEDISSDDAHSLHNLMGIFVRKGPEVVQMSLEEIESVVKLWKKFTELRCIIDSSLQGIEDRWSEGKGPLAQEFTCNETRELIRALFQNTDRRASLLTKIRPPT